MWTCTENVAFSVSLSLAGGVENVVFTRGFPSKDP